ncbi:hypothetical protein HJG60_009630 [Phyllostomus discolor]|uniref:Uncharacterized protein n=1 Tax=Phyllostomus discolor TaxID=89673 RepID=A0A833YEL9_9CHIR|nr:hypothetical protein HJG60_009630 [Phyllostomus discolor]
MPLAPQTRLRAVDEALGRRRARVNLLSPKARGWSGGSGSGQRRAGAAATQTHERSQRGRGRRAESGARTARAPQSQPYLEMRPHRLRNARADLSQPRTLTHFRFRSGSFRSRDRRRRVGGAEVQEEQGAQAPGKRRAALEPRERCAQAPRPLSGKPRLAAEVGDRGPGFPQAQVGRSTSSLWRGLCCRVERRAVESPTPCFCGSVAGRRAPARARAATAPMEGGAQGRARTEVQPRVVSRDRAWTLSQISALLRLRGPARSDVPQP